MSPTRLDACLALGLGVLVVPGCFEDAAMDPDTSSGGSTSGGSTATSSTSGDSASNTTDSDSMSTSSTTAGDSCGDGVLDAGEECDLGSGNSDSGACTSTCKQAQCGDALLHLAEEECDDGNTVDDDGCTNMCTSPTCGDSIVQAGEECDDGPGNGPQAPCSLDCKAAICGDGAIQGQEECDNGANNGEGQLCTDDCLTNVCGDSNVAPNEGCDDGNTRSGDGCSADCKLEACGDGVVDEGEDCDDGNAVNTDECTDLCRLPSCGDAHVQDGEECDDGANNGDGKACTSSCKNATCGDGHVHTGQEECDDGNIVDDDGCTNACTLPACGDGIVQASEQCDDGGTVSGDGCSSTCKLEECGNGIVDPGEDCDDGANGNQDDGCTDVCKYPTCGDGIHQPNEGEDCDDGNENNNDSCPNDCQDPVCGDSVIEGLEVCEPNDLNGQTCQSQGFDGGTLACSANCDQFNTSSCHKCGNGVLEGPEECDDGDTMSGDGCSSACLIEGGGTPNYVFVTSQTWTYSSGIDAAHALCNELAAAANLPGNYVALLSTSTQNARDRLGSARGWIGTSGLPFGDTVSDIFDSGQVFYPIQADETGQPTSSGAVTGTSTDGTGWANYMCSDWTSTSGSTKQGTGKSGSPAWLNYSTVACTGSARLYCFQTDNNVAVAPTFPANYRLAFLTESTYVPGGGIGQMDGYCQQEAEAAGISDNGNKSFIAFLGQESLSPIGRFDTTGPTWVRVDGVRLAGTAADLAANTTLAPITQYASGPYYFGRPLTGGTAPNTSAAGETCNDWASSSSLDKGRRGWAENANSLFGWPAQNCDIANRFYCLEK